eukprot:gene9633-biopygen8910
MWSDHYLYQSCLFGCMVFVGVTAVLPLLFMIVGVARRVEVGRDCNSASQARLGRALIALVSPDFCAERF